IRCRNVTGVQTCALPILETRERFPARGDGTTPAPGGPVMRALLPLATLFCLLMSLPLLGTLVRGDGWWVPAVVLMVSATAVSAGSEERRVGEDGSARCAS